MNVDSLQRSIGYQFEDADLLHTALTHRSAGQRNYERLEFLGDALLNLVIADEVSERFPDAPEGDLTRARARLVRESTLAEIGKQLCLGELMALGAAAAHSGGHRRRSILADIVESLLGAIYREAGFETARRVVLSLFESRLESLPSLDSLKDAKTRLQEWLQARSLELPRYEVSETTGPDHDRQFVVHCHYADRVSHGQGTSRRRAEQAAADAALGVLGARPSSTTETGESE